MAFLTRGRRQASLCVTLLLGLTLELIGYFTNAWVVIKEKPHPLLPQQGPIVKSVGFWEKCQAIVGGTLCAIHTKDFTGVQLDAPGWLFTCKVVEGVGLGFHALTLVLIFLFVYQGSTRLLLKRVLMVCIILTVLVVTAGGTMFMVYFYKSDWKLQLLVHKQEKPSMNVGYSLILVICAVILDILALVILRSIQTTLLPTTTKESVTSSKSLMFMIRKHSLQIAYGLMIPGLVVLGLGVCTYEWTTGLLPNGATATMGIWAKCMKNGGITGCNFHIRDFTLPEVSDKTSKWLISAMVLCSSAALFHLLAVLFTSVHLCTYASRHCLRKTGFVLMVMTAGVLLAGAGTFVGFAMSYRDDMQAKLGPAAGDGKFSLGYSSICILVALAIAPISAIFLFLDPPGYHASRNGPDGFHVQNKSGLIKDEHEMQGMPLMK